MREFTRLLSTPYKRNKAPCKSAAMNHFEVNLITRVGGPLSAALIQMLLLLNNPPSSPTYVHLPSFARDEDTGFTYPLVFYMEEKKREK